MIKQTKRKNCQTAKEPTFCGFPLYKLLAYDKQIFLPMTSASVLTHHPSHDHHRCCTVGTSDLWIKRQLMCSSPVQKYTLLLFNTLLLPTDVTASRCDSCRSVDTWRSLLFPLLFFELIPKIF
uniref:Uncharacterized protein n=1 Tax=Aegilops tauschii subsp. strangulata TaxID=200361 RepID=A0A453MGA7_AEGTS